MPHRTILATVLLLGVAMLAVYARLTWSPVDPLSFRVVHDREEYILNKYDERLWIYEVEVQNASAVDIDVWSASLIVQHPAGQLNEYYGSLHAGVSGQPDSGYPLGTVPARGTLRCRALVPEGRRQSFRTGTRTDVEFEWRSQTKQKFDWLADQTRKLLFRWKLQKLGDQIAGAAVEYSVYRMEPPTTTMRGQGSD